MSPKAAPSDFLWHISSMRFITMDSTASVGKVKRKGAFVNHLNGFAAAVRIFCIYKIILSVNDKLRYYIFYHNTVNKKRDICKYK